MKTIAACMLLAAALTANAFEDEVWISPAGPRAVTVGSLPKYYPNARVLGSPIYPFRCPDGESLNYLLTKVLTRPNLTIHFMAGTFHVQAFDTCWFATGIYPLNGWKLRGAGIDNTVLRLDPVNYSPRGGGVAMIEGPGEARARGVEVSDMTIDCNLQNSAGLGGSSAVVIFGDDAKISRVKAINWGTTTAGECFVLVAGPAPAGASPTYATNEVIEDCVVTQPAKVAPGSGGVTAIGINTEGANNPCAVTGAVVRNNLVCNVQVGTAPGQVASIHAYGTGGVNCGNQAINLTGSSAAVGFYRDSWNSRDGVIANNTVDNVTVGILFNLHSPSVKNLVIRDNVIRPAQGGEGIAFANYAGLAAASENIIIKDNVVYPADGVDSETAFGMSGAVTASVIGNVFQGAGGKDIMMPDFADGPPHDPAAPKFLAWENNYNFAGSAIPRPGLPRLITASTNTASASITQVGSLP